MSLVKFSFKPDPIPELQQKVRHLYDIHQLLEKERLGLFLESVDFEILLLKVAKDDFISYPNDNQWLFKSPKDALLFAEPAHTWQLIRKTYFSDFKTLVYGQLPPEDLILKTLNQVAQRMKEIHWNIHR
jgi:hypothetical protein